MTNTHYCFSGEAHNNESCDCDCGPCKTKKQQIKREIFNKKLSEELLKQGQQIKKFTDWMIKIKEFRDSVFDPKICRKIDFKIKNEFGERYFLIANNDKKCTILELYKFGEPIGKRNFGWFSTPEKAYEALKRISKI